MQRLQHGTSFVSWCPSGYNCLSGVRGIADTRFSSDTRRNVPDTEKRVKHRKKGEMRGETALQPWKMEISPFIVGSSPTGGAT